MWYDEELQKMYIFVESVDYDPYKDSKKYEVKLNAAHKKMIIKILEWRTKEVLGEEEEVKTEAPVQKEPLVEVISDDDEAEVEEQGKLVQESDYPSTTRTNVLNTEDILVISDNDEEVVVNKASDHSRSSTRQLDNETYHFTLLQQCLRYSYAKGYTMLEDVDTMDDESQDLLNCDQLLMMVMSGNYDFEQCVLE